MIFFLFKTKQEAKMEANIKGTQNDQKSKFGYKMKYLINKKWGIQN